ncbi:hypothetical protein AAG906_026311 [Vitis piasezkii]
MERNSISALHGQATVSTLILQDCAVGLLFALLPVLGGTSGILQGNYKVLACQTLNVSQEQSDISLSRDEQQNESITRDSRSSEADNDPLMDSVDRMPVSSSTEESLAMTVSFADAPGSTFSVYTDSKVQSCERLLLGMAL